MGRNWAWKLKEKSWACGRLFFSECWEQCCTFRVILSEAEGFLCPTRLPWECSGEPSDRPRHVLWVNPGGQLSPTQLLAHITSWWERGWKQKSTSVKICELSSQLKFLKKEINKQKKEEKNQIKTKQNKKNKECKPTHNCYLPADWCPDSSWATAALENFFPSFYCWARGHLAWSVPLVSWRSLSQLLAHSQQPVLWSGGMRSSRHCSAIATTLV